VQSDDDKDVRPRAPASTRPSSAKPEEAECQQQQLLFFYPPSLPFPSVHRPLVFVDYWVATRF